MGININFCGIPLDASEAKDSSVEETEHQHVVIKTCQVRELVLELDISEDIVIGICQGDAYS